MDFNNLLKEHCSLFFHSKNLAVIPILSVLFFHWLDSLALFFLKTKSKPAGEKHRALFSVQTEGNGKSSDTLQQNNKLAWNLTEDSNALSPSILLQYYTYIGMDKSSRALKAKVVWSAKHNDGTKNIFPLLKIKIQCNQSDKNK